VSNQNKSSDEEPGEFLRTFGKALLTVVLGFAALVALGASVCGVFWPAGGSVVVVSLIVLALLIGAIIWLWR
jgi:uncharacterized membrane protein YqjE